MPVRRNRAAPGRRILPPWSNESCRAIESLLIECETGTTKRGPARQGLQELSVLYSQGLLPQVSARASNPSALIVPWSRRVAVRSGRDIVEIDAIGRVIVELSVEKVILQRVVPRIGQRRLPQSVVGSVDDAGHCR